MAAHDRLFVISGCSGGGKSTLIAELARRGHAVVAEPGRRIIADGGPTPWEDLPAFLHHAVDMAIADHAAALARGTLAFFDRGLVDAVLALERLGGADTLRARCRQTRYAATVFLAPPWPEIYVVDADRRHGMTSAITEYEHLARGYPELGYRVVALPRLAPGARADFVEQTVAEQRRI